MVVVVAVLKRVAWLLVLPAVALVVVVVVALLGVVGVGLALLEVVGEVGLQAMGP